MKLLTASNTTITPIDDCWDNTNEELKVVTECGRKPVGALKIIFSRVVENKIALLMKRFPHTEWLAYLIGDDDTRFVRDIVLPAQEVSTGHVTVTGSAPSSNVIGVIHSHHNMGAFFSGTDEQYINGNYDISIVVAHNGSKAQVRWVTPCGFKVVTEGIVVIESENLFDETSFLTTVDDVVSERNVMATNINFADRCNKSLGVQEVDTTDEFSAMDSKYDCLNPNKYRRGIRLDDISNDLKDELTGALVN